MTNNRIQKSKITSLGIGITNKCNLNCPHCYSRPLPKLDFKPAEFLALVKSYPNLKKVNFGTGESILNPDFPEIMSICRKRGIKMALTTNGLTVQKMEDKYLRWLQDIDFSLDFPTAKLHDSWRGSQGLFGATLKGIERCQKLKINTSIVCCLMGINYKYLPGFRKILDKYGIYLRLNLYKSAWTGKFRLDYNEFWQAIKILAKNFRLVSNSEPILSIITKSRPGGSPCGECSARVHPDKSVTPCVYLHGKNMSFREFLDLKKFVPDFCKKCGFLRFCHGGCLSRRILDGSPEKPDFYCPLYNKKSLPKIKFRTAKDKEFIHSGYLCTMIVK